MLWITGWGECLHSNMTTTQSILPRKQRNDFRKTLWKSKGGPARVLTKIQKSISGEFWKWLCIDAPHPIWVSWNNSAKKTSISVPDLISWLYCIILPETCHWHTERKRNKREGAHLTLTFLCMTCFFFLKGFVCSGKTSAVSVACILVGYCLAVVLLTLWNQQCKFSCLWSQENVFKWFIYVLV